MSWKTLQYGVGILYSLQVGWKPVSKISASYEPTARPPDDKLMYAEGQYCSHWQSTITEKSSCRCHCSRKIPCELFGSGRVRACTETSQRPAGKLAQDSSVGARTHADTHTHKPATARVAVSPRTHHHTPMHIDNT